MRRFPFAVCFVCLVLTSPWAQAWNAAGHRLSAIIAWQQLSPGSRAFVDEALTHHPDHARWQEKARSGHPGDIFAEAATWPDDIRNDPRFHDEDREAPTPPLPGLNETARHKRWHYVDLDAAGRVRDGELDRQIERLAQRLRTSRDTAQIAAALPWLIHLVADIHQPLHVGRHGDEGGNQVEIENPFNKRLPFSKLHLYWDDLPGPPWLRGKRLQAEAARLLEQPAPVALGPVGQWREESHRLLALAYPQTAGSLLPVITEEFDRQAHALADQRILYAGYRLAALLESIHAYRVSHGTP